MPINKNAFKRYKVIDMLLRNKMRRYPTLEEITEICKEKLDLKNLSSETIKKDIDHMRESQPSGFDAPISYNKQKRGYEYLDPDFVLGGVSLNDSDVDAIKESIDLIRSIGGLEWEKSSIMLWRKFFQLYLKNSQMEQKNSLFCKQ